MYTVQYAKDLKWNEPEHTSFDCVVKYQEFDRELPATINAQDTYAHIKELWARGTAGEFGEIAEYVPPPEPPKESEV